MAAVDAEPSIQPQTAIHTRRRRKKGRFIKQGYHKSERDDARRVAARAFLSGITLDRHLRQGEGSLESYFAPHSPGPHSVTSRHSNILNDDTSIQLGLSTINYIRPTTPPSRRLHEILQDSSFKVPPSKSLEQQLSPVHPYLVNRSASCIESPVSEKTFWGDRRQLLQLAHSHWHSLPSTDQLGPFIQFVHSPQGHNVTGNTRIAFVASGKSLCALSSILSYDRRELRQEHPHERTRVRTNSMSLQLELEGIELGTSNTEVSLAFLLIPIWGVIPEVEVDTPLLTRRHSMKRIDSEKRSSNSTLKPRSLDHLEVMEDPTVGASFPWQSFKDHHSATHVILNYHPHCLDNHEYFVGRNTTTLTPHGYRVSIIQYARASDTKRGINDQFSEVFPHIRLTLSKLRKIKREMHRIVMECEKSHTASDTNLDREVWCDLDLASVAYAYVYYEKLVLMGKITKPIGKIVAGCCLLLASKFFTDIKRPEIKVLIEKITDVFRISSKELLLYEFPVLASLQFSLLTPDRQVQTHYDKLRELALDLS